MEKKEGNKEGKKKLIVSLIKLKNPGIISFFSAWICSQADFNNDKMAPSSFKNPSLKYDFFLRDSNESSQTETPWFSSGFIAISELLWLEGCKTLSGPGTYSST